tara:strand:+ start:6362 stop:6556 length:195 start_codon:yes stop_codon:yes gene_type:complete
MEDWTTTEATPNTNWGDSVADPSTSYSTSVNSVSTTYKSFQVLFFADNLNASWEGLDEIVWGFE